MSKSRDKVNYCILILRCHTKYKDIRFSRFHDIWMQTSHPTKNKTENTYLTKKTMPCIKALYYNKETTLLTKDH